MNETVREMLAREAREAEEVAEAEARGEVQPGSSPGLDNEPAGRESPDGVVDMSLTCMPCSSRVY